MRISVLPFINVRALSHFVNARASSSTPLDQGGKRVGEHLIVVECPKPKY